jgi:hypothetical protein
MWWWLPWAVSFALLPAFLAYGGWGGLHAGPPPWEMTGLAALVGIGITSSAPEPRSSSG